MTPKISLITATVGAALVFAVPAAWGDSWYADRQEPAAVVSPDVIDRAVAAKQRDATVVNTYRDAFERAVVGGQNSQAPLSTYRDAFERAVIGGQLDQTNLSVSPDAFERAAAQNHGLDSNLSSYRDSFERAALPTGPVQVSATSSGRELEWPQIGIGFGIGIVLMLGLYLTLKSTRQRPLAH